MFFDEPTSGLDAFMAATIVDAMVQMAQQRGKTIICTIHQPSTETFAKFDKLCLMAEGRLAYLGENSQALGFFTRFVFFLIKKPFIARRKKSANLLLSSVLLC